MLRNLDEDGQKLSFAPAEPADLYPILNRAASMWPLVFVFALLPALVGSRRPAIDAWDAAWGLKALVMAERSSGAGAAGAERPLGAEPFAEAPPLGSWLAAGVMQVTRPSSWRWLFLPSLIATGAFVGAAYLCLDALLGSRVALLGVAVLALHAPLLAMTSDASPLLWSLPAAGIAVWGAVAHWRKPREWVSLPLVACSLAFGLCFLAGGVVALALLITVGLAGLARMLPGPKAASEPKSRGRSLAAALPPVLAVGVAALLGLFFGSWWLLAASGGEAKLIGIRSFLGIGFQAGRAGAAELGWEASSSAVNGLTGALSFLQALAGVFVLGLLDALGCIHSRRGEETAGGENALGTSGSKSTTKTSAASPPGTGERSTAASLRAHSIAGTDFLLLWLAVGLAFWGASELIGDLLRPWSDLWKRYLILPVLGLSAHGLNLMIRRRVSIRIAILVVVGTALALLLGHEYRVLAAAAFAYAPAWATAACVVVALLATWLLDRYCRTSEVWQRRAMKVCVWSILIGNMAAGLASASGWPVVLEASPAEGRRKAERAGGSGSPRPQRDGATREVSRKRRSGGRGAEALPLQDAAAIADQLRRMPGPRLVVIAAPSTLARPVELVVRSEWPDVVCLSDAELERALAVAEDRLSVLASAEKERLFALLVVDRPDADSVAEKQLKPRAPTITREGPPIPIDGTWIECLVIRFR